MKSFPTHTVCSGAGLLAACCGLVGCGDTGQLAPRWTQLARGFEPQPLIVSARAWCQADPDGPTTRARIDDDDARSVWIETTLRREDWQPAAAEGVFWVPRPRAGGFAHLPEGPVRLRSGEQAFERVLAEQGPMVGAFAVVGEQVLIAVAPGEEAPEEAVFGARVDNGADFDGLWRIHEGRRAAAGIPVWSGAQEQVVCDIPRNARLSLVTSYEGPPGVAGEEPTYRILLDGELVFEYEGDDSATAHRIDLPADGRRGASFVFEMRGPRGVGFFFDPVLGPAELGRYGARPWGDSRPDVILLLADTFRADNLATYGAEAGNTPRLDQLAARSVRFMNARAPSTWTLPSTSSLFTGLFPGQHGATKDDLGLPSALVTIAETFTEAGYRTGAITDASFVSTTFGLDQGFAWFEEHPWKTWNMEQTLEKSRAFLDRDDGRPVFLLVHTYRVHSPYRLGPEEDSTRWDALVAQGLERIEEMRAAGDLNTAARHEVLLSVADQMRALYLGGVRELDRALGTFIDELRETGFLDTSYLLFTSDHGEAFGENEDIFHGRGLWDVKLKVPLLIHGPGLEPRDVHWSASLVDVAPTLAALAGIAPRPEWAGSNLLALDRARPAFAFRLETKRELAIIDGDRKVMALPDPAALRRGEHVACFDLASDPGEERDLRGEAPEWAAELARRVADAVSILLMPLEDSVLLDVDPEMRRRLAEIGYGGDD